MRPRANSSDLTGDFQLTGADGQPYLIFRYGVLRVWQETVDALLGAGLGLAPLALFTDESSRDPIAAVDRVQAELQRARVPGNVALDVFDSLLLLGGMRHPAELIEDLRRRIAVKFDHRESSYYQILRNEIFPEALQQGQLIEAQNILLRLAGRKFGGPAPAPTEAAVRALTDRARLERMTDRIFDATSWDDLLATP